jgi:hypothetical protein
MLAMLNDIYKVDIHMRLPLLIISVVSFHNCKLVCNTDPMLDLTYTEFCSEGALLRILHPFAGHQFHLMSAHQMPENWIQMNVRRWPSPGVLHCVVW